MVKDTVDPLSGKLVKRNNSFENEAAAFVNAIPPALRRTVLSNQDLADHLYSYSYNVGAGRFKERVVPKLIDYYNGKATIDDVTNSMWAAGDTKLKGLRLRREVEKEGVKNAL
jgi:GH24 family phage-related lysozyme (muramidase)